MHPELPIFTAHYSDGIGTFLFGGRFQRHLTNLALFNMYGFDVEHFSQRLNARTIQFASTWVLAHRRGQTVYHQVNLTQVMTNYIGGLCAHFIRECIAI